MEKICDFLVGITVLREMSLVITPVRELRPTTESSRGALETDRFQPTDDSWSLTVKPLVPWLNGQELL